MRWTLPTAAYVAAVCTNSNANMGFGPLGNLAADHLEEADFALLLHRNEGELFEAAFGAKWAEALASAHAHLNATRAAWQALYARLMHDAPTQKVFASRLAGLPHSALLFDVFAGRAVDVAEAAMLAGHHLDAPPPP